MKQLSLLLLLTLSVAWSTSVWSAEGQKREPVIYDAQDSYYFTKDDGEMSEEEMDLEAFYVYKDCNRNILKNIYYSCECIAGAFRQIREDEGPITPQTHITNEIYQDTNTPCTNTIGIAGANYQECLQMASVMRTREKNNNEYCSCVGNKVANDFTSLPKLKSYHIKDIKVNAMLHCDEPNNLAPYEKKASAQ